MQPTTNPIEVFTEFFNNLFQHIRTPHDAKALAVLNHLEGLSLSAIARELESIGVKVSRMAICKWLKRLKKFIKRATVPKYREVIAVDETKLKINGKQVIIWASIDISTREIIAISVTKYREAHDALMFLRKTLSMCDNKPLVLVDRGPWYLYALERLGLQFEHKTRGMRNRIERWFRTLKDRTKRFYNNFPYRNLISGICEVEEFLKLFIFWYNCLRFHESLGCSPISIKEVMA